MFCLLYYQFSITLRYCSNVFIVGFEQKLVIALVFLMLSLNYWVNSNHYPGIFVANFEKISHVAPVYLLFTLKKLLSFFSILNKFNTYEAVQ